MLQGAVILGKQAGFAIFNVMEWAKHKGPAELKSKSEWAPTPCQRPDPSAVPDVVLSSVTSANE